MSHLNQYCTFYLDRSLFGVEVHKVQEVLRDQDMTHVPLAPDVVRGLINLRGQIVTAIDLRARLQRGPRKGEGRSMNVVLRTDEGAVSLLVDEIGDVVEVDAAALERPPENLSGLGRELIQHVVKVESELLLLLDTDKVLGVPAEA
ncbi:MAG: chemotaxis protein CheW [Planctomycetaceae bacterium]|nr:chemotaxis protein CheW [Planctomycetaceae bacterium]